MADQDSELLSYDASGAFLPKTGIDRDELQSLYPRLNAARTEVVEEDMRHYSDPLTIPDRKRPLDAAFFDLPERTLSAYERDKTASELGRILSAAERIRGLSDRVVTLGIGGSYMGAKALMDACCEPYFNELSRAARGSRPRMYFEGNNVDNDASQGLLKLLGNGRRWTSSDERWALVVISKSGGTLETAVAFRQFLSVLRSACGDDNLLREIVLPVTGRTGRLRDLSQALGCREVFDVPDGVGGRFSILSSVGLLPAALLGIDVVRLLRGAVAMNQHFKTAPLEQNVVLQFVGVSHLLETRRNLKVRVLSVWSKALESMGLWYDQLLAESLGKEEQGATPITTVNTRDLHSRAQQHQEGQRDKLITNIYPAKWRADPLPVGESEFDQDKLNALSGKALPELMAAAIAGTNQAYREDGRPTTDIRLPVINEWAMGQLFQMLMLATVVEGRLMGMNPYGQPGVEKYKQNMARILAST